MTSTIYLYKDSKIIPSKNFVVEGIENYLDSLTKITISNFQYLRNDLNLTIKINKNQEYTDSVYTFNYNYLKVVQNSVNYYYFIVKKTQIAQDTIALELKMDTLNTYKWDTDFKVSPRTKVSREHKDRFTPYVELHRGSMNLGTLLESEKLYTGKLVLTNEDNEEYQLDAQLYWVDNANPILKFLHITNIPDNQYQQAIDGNYTNVDSFIVEEDKELLTFPTGWTLSNFQYRRKVVRKIDLKSEDIPAPLYKKSESNVYANKGETLFSWALYYKNHDNQEDSPVDCYLCTDTPQPFTYTAGEDLDVNDIPLDKYVILSRWYEDSNFAVEFDDEHLSVYNRTTLGMSYYHCVVLWNDGGTLKIIEVVYVYKGLPNTASVYSQKIYTPVGSVKVLINKDEVIGREVSDYEGPWTGGTASYPFYKSRANITITLGALSSTIINGVASIDKTLSTNLKIINIPYSPSQLDLDSDGNYSIDPIWVYDSSLKFFRLTDLSTPFINKITSNNESILEQFTDIDINEYTYHGEPVITINRTIKDSKLYHSDFYYKKFVYDSFGKMFPLEKINYIESYANQNYYKDLEFTFIMTRNIVSKFLFKFDFVYSDSTEDYPNALPVERNNEEVLYTSAYLNYVRTGYNYDLKAKKRSEVVSGATIGLSAVGTILSAVVGVATNNPIAVGTAIASGVGLATSLVNYAKTTAQNEENIARKLEEAQRQAVSVSSADDFDLLKAYTDNKAKICVYKCSEQMEGILDDIFYYFGYKVDEMKIPETNTRNWFNFVACELEYTGLDKNISQLCKEDLINKYREGATFLHENEISSTKVWDFDQVKENWELSLFYE